MAPRKLAAAAAAAIALAASAASADLVVNTNLGTLAPGTYPFAGTTVGGASNADTYAPIGNSAAIWDQEFVYQFTTTQSVRASLTSTDPNGAIDNDFWLLNSLSTHLNSNALREANVVPSQTALVEVSGSFGLINPGTYYLSIDAWRGNPTVAGTPPSGRAGPFSGTLSLQPIVAPAALPSSLGGSLAGVLGPGQIVWYSFNYNGTGPLRFDTEGSLLAPSNDTELGLYDSTGNLIGTDDDDGTGLLSLLETGDELPANLPAGQYYLAIGGFNTTFDTGWGVTSTSTNTGAYIINGISVPEPGTLVGMAAVGLTMLRRRRS